MMRFATVWLSAYKAPAGQSTESKKLPAPVVIPADVEELSGQIEHWRSTRLHHGVRCPRRFSLQRPTSPSNMALWAKSEYRNHFVDPADIDAAHSPGRHSEIPAPCRTVRQSVPEGVLC
jgi:hypothetical protein